MNHSKQSTLFRWKKQIVSFIMEFLNSRGLKPRPFVMRYLESHDLIPRSTQAPEQCQHTPPPIPEQPQGNYFRFTLSGPDPIQALKQLLAQGFPDIGLPTKLWINREAKEVSPQWMDLLHPSEQYQTEMEWGNGSRIRVFWYALELSPDNLYKTYLVNVSTKRDMTPMELLALLKDVPFLLGSTKTRYPEWLLESAESGAYKAPTFDDEHYRHGWACLFKGEGHRRLVSRRWLDFGPWRVLRGENDLTLVQFHDLKADAKTALEQARIGHERMGFSKKGECGFIEIRGRHSLYGRYFPEQDTLEFAIHGQEISQRDMLKACAVRFQKYIWPTDDEPINHIRYVFIEEEEARKYLHELWLRELECWTFVQGKLMRIDTDYHPKPNPPEWVKRLEEREGKSDEKSDDNGDDKENDLLSYYFQIQELQTTEDQYQFLLVTEDHGITMGFRVTVARTMQAGFDEQSNPIFGRTYKNGITFSRSGPESDHWVANMAKRCSFQTIPSTMVERESFTAIILENGEIDLEKQAIHFKLFGNENKEKQTSSYESMFVLDIPNGLATWSEKHPAYRKSLISALSGTIS